MEAEIVSGKTRKSTSRGDFCFWLDVVVNLEILRTIRDNLIVTFNLAFSFLQNMYLFFFLCSFTFMIEITGLIYVMVIHIGYGSSILLQRAIVLVGLYSSQLGGTLYS